MRSSDLYQISLIALGAIAAALFGVFLYRELYPEYKIYQNDYVALEKFRSSYTGEPPSPFQEGVKQILLEREDKGPPVIDRCISCHVALQINDFSPTKIARDINGNMVLDTSGTPVKVPNENYIWEKLDKKIAELSDEKLIEQLRSTGEKAAADQRLIEAEKLRSLKTAQVGDHIYDVTKVLAMHPLIGKETRPFEYHALEDYGCVSCHNGNGRGLTTEKAHGPVFDGEYVPEFTGPKPTFTESDPNNDPPFAHMFNSKPGHELLFQTTPLFVGNIIQAKCLQCHQPSTSAIQGSIDTTATVSKQRERRTLAIKNGFENEKQELNSLLSTKLQIEHEGLNATIESLKARSNDVTLPVQETEKAASQLKYLTQTSNGKNKTEKQFLEEIDQQLNEMVGSPELSKNLISQVKVAKNTNFEPIIEAFLAAHQKEQPEGSLFAKAAAWNLENELLRHVKDTQTSLQKTVSDQTFVNAATTDVDILTSNFQHGQDLYISQACYACHRISGLARGGVGPELTRIGTSYPWYIKESIVWPQADLPTSTMPNFRLDHEELSDLMTFLLGQTGENASVSDTSYKIAIQEWEAGRKKPWEQALTPSQRYDLRYAMTVFATEGCAACHRLEGFESDVGYKIQKEQGDKVDFKLLYKEHEWFEKLIPENILGSQLVAVLDQNADEIDQHIVDQVRKDSIIEEIEKNHPELIEGYYTDFKYAMRAKNHYYAELLAATDDPKKKKEIEAQLQKWKSRVHRVLMVYIQEYGLGRLIGPRPNWSGVFRTDEWLMEHFHDPSSHVPRSIMPIFPFDESKFQALTRMLDILGIRNRNALRQIWEHNGFSPELAFKIHCAQCHGDLMIGNGPVAEWIYPIPKNLRNADFLRNLTKERVIFSITHGVKGTPMPPWGEVATDKPTADGIPVLNKNEIHQLADWLFSSLPGNRVIEGHKDVPKWEYTPKDVIEELHKEGNTLPAQEGSPLGLLINKNIYYASLNPVPTSPNSDSDVAAYFDVKPNPPGDPDKYSYYIKHKFYTDYNLQQGKQFFELNCAPCHGKEADGTGLRSEVMQDAKPRMLINLDWQNMRDDLRLLRSIKYGVPGTSMTPWGDMTSSLLRMQLVMYIRSLTQDHEIRNTLSTTLYQTFDAMQQVIEQARAKEYPSLQKIQHELEQVQSQQASIDAAIKSGQSIPKDANLVYQNKLELLSQLQQHQATDQLFLELQKKLQNERTLYEDIGKELISANIDEGILKKYDALIALNKNKFTLQEGKLTLQLDKDNQKKIDILSKEIIDFLSQQIAETEKQKTIEEGKITSATRMTTIAELTTKLNSLIKLKKKIQVSLAEAQRIQEQEAEIIKKMSATKITTVT